MSASQLEADVARLADDFSNGPEAEELPADLIVEQLRNSIEVVSKIESEDASKSIEAPTLEGWHTTNMQILLDYYSPPIEPWFTLMLMKINCIDAVAGGLV